MLPGAGAMSMPPVVPCLVLNVFVALVNFSPVNSAPTAGGHNHNEDG